MKSSFINTLVVAFVFGLFSMVGCIRKPPVDVPDSEGLENLNGLSHYLTTLSIVDQLTFCHSFILQ